MASLTLLALAACAGTKARDDALLPIAKNVYQNVRTDIDRGIADAVEDGDLTEGAAAHVAVLADRLGEILDSGDRSLLASFPWPTLETYAVRGVQDMISDGDVSEGVAIVLLQRIVNFRDVLARLGARVSFTALTSIDGALPLTPHNAPRAALGVFIKGQR